MSVLWGVRWMPIPGKPPLRPLLLPLRVLKLFAFGKQLSYDTQLDLKRNVIVKAYRNFSGTTSTVPSVVYLLNNGASITGLAESSLPTIGTTIPSPLQYGYRTKITPHFKEPPKKAKRAEGSTKPDWLKIGFNMNDTSQVLDIEVSELSCQESMVANLLH